MSSVFPSKGIRKKHKRIRSADATGINDTITVAADHYGVVYRVWLDLDVSSEADLENLPADLVIQFVIGTLIFDIDVHPFIEHTDAAAGAQPLHRHVNLGPWFFDLGPDGLYSGVLGDDIVLTVGSAGTGIKTKVHYLYSD